MRRFEENTDIEKALQILEQGGRSTRAEDERSPIKRASYWRIEEQQEEGGRTGQA